MAAVSWCFRLLWTCLPEENVSYSKEWYEESPSPNSAHAQFATDHLLCKIVFQDTKQEQFAVRSLDAVTIYVTIHRDFDVCTESQLDMSTCIIPVSLDKIISEKSKNLSPTVFRAIHINISYLRQRV